MENQPKINWRSGLYLGALMLAGESIYLLPYLRKTFQTSLELSFGLDAAQVGWLSSSYGLVALLCYFPGGWLADRFYARDLLAVSLLSTGLSGLLMLGSPGFPLLVALHGFWGISSILTFWGALIKATRIWGGPQRLGRSYGWLDAGRGAVAALFASLATAWFALASQPQEGLDRVLLLYSLAPLGTAILLLVGIPRRAYAASEARGAAGWKALRPLLTHPGLGQLSLIVICAYWLYLGTFDFPAYLERVQGGSKGEGAALGALRDWMRPVGALAAGFLADRWKPSRSMALAFSLLIGAYAWLALVPASRIPMATSLIPMLTGAFAAFGLRGVYFAALAEIGIPLSHTGLAVGLISFLGFLPDVFVHLLSGILVDTWGPEWGYRYHFAWLTLLAILGWWSSKRLGAFQSSGGL